ncbi:hypothetical protein B0T12DRAFT_146421 [Alternaria alternata]|nr:hypothetical protein B0T12DRAFT_146421 [Alternaria alternata]
MLTAVSHLTPSWQVTENARNQIQKHLSPNRDAIPSEGGQRDPRPRGCKKQRTTQLRRSTCDTWGPSQRSGNLPRPCEPSPFQARYPNSLI